MSRRTKTYRPTEPGTPANRLRPIEKFKPLDPDKPLMPTRAPALKAFDRELPGQGRFDFSSDDPGAVLYADDEREDGHGRAPDR